MTKEFKEFINIVRNGIATGEVITKLDLSDFDLAVQYAIGQIGERKGYPLKVTLEEIEAEIDRFAPELSEEYKGEQE